MNRYIFGKRNLIHIIDIRETIKGILRAKKFLATTVSKGEDILFVGTKRQARNTIMETAQRTGMHYVTERWLGGTLTNFRTIRSRLARLEELEAIEAAGMAGQYSKKMIATLTRERRKIQRNLEGIRRMNKLPGALVIVDVRREYIAAREAKKLQIPIIALIDTDSDPDYVDLPIPGNDDAMRAIQLVITALGDAVEQGRRSRPESDRSTAHGSAGRHARRAAGAATRSATQAVGPTEGEPADQGDSAAAENPPASSPVASA